MIDIDVIEADTK